jgi:hypothetical protein
MTKTAGIIIERDASGTPRYVLIDLKRYADQLAAFFKANNIEVEKIPYNRKSVKPIREQEKLPSKKVDLSKHGIS